MDITNIVRIKIQEYINLLTELERLIPPYGPKRFASALLQIVRTMEDFYQAEIKNALDVEDETYIQQISAKYLEILQKMHGNPMQFLQRGDEYFVPSEILMTMTSFVDQLSDRNIDFSISPQWDYMYGFFGYKDIVKNFLRDIAVDYSLVERLQEEQPELFVFVTYPYVEHRNILLHSIMIHEVSHLVDWLRGITVALEGEITLDQESLEHHLSEEKKLEINLSPSQEEEVQGPTQITLEGILGKSIETVFRNDCKEVVKSWLKEVIADVLSVHALGPAYVFAANEFFTLIADMDQYSPSHPSSRLRMKFLLEELEENDYLSDLENSDVKEKLIELISLIEPQYIVEPNDRRQKVAYETITKNIVIIREKARSCVPYSYGAQTFNRHVDNYVKDYLSKGIPQADIWDDSGEKNIDVNIISILNAGWQLYLTDMDKYLRLFDANSIEEKNRALNNLYELIIRAMETSQILRIWKGRDH